MQSSKEQAYVKNMNKVLDYIDRHIDHPFSLDELTKLTSFSKFHFHRIFHAFMEESVFQYILRIRLEKCASLLLMEPSRKLADIALQFGFSDQAIFSRHFKKHFKMTPTVFKTQFLKNSNNDQTESNHKLLRSKIAPYFCSDSKTVKWTSRMEMIKNVEVKNFKEVTVAYVRNFGPYVGKDFSYEKGRSDLFAWSAAKGILQNPDFKYLILYHDNPQVALSDKLRMSLCVTIPAELETTGAIGKMTVADGLYLVCDCELHDREYAQVWDWIYGHWFPTNEYKPADKPYFELYTEQPQGDKLKVSFCIPVQANA